MKSQSHEPHLLSEVWQTACRFVQYPLFPNIAHHRTECKTKNRTFPLFNIADHPTYFMALKDNARLVKLYAMVNVQQYQIVATGQTVADTPTVVLRNVGDSVRLRYNPTEDGANALLLDAVSVENP